MSNDKPRKTNKLKAHTSAMAQAGNDNLDGLITILATTYPVAAGLLKLAQISFGHYLIYKQEELNQFTEFLQNNPDVFAKEITETKEFRDGFTIELEHYFKLRTDQKRQIAHQIFLDFGKSIDKADYPLERYHDTLEKISTSGLQLLAFLRSTIYPFRIKEINDSVEAMHLPDPAPAGHLSKEEWFEQKLAAEPISKFINKWLEEKYNFNNPACRAEFNLPNTIGEEEMENLNRMRDAKRSEIYNALGELEQLGLANGFVTGMGQWGGGGYEHNLTGYGKNFIEFILEGLEKK